MKKLGLFYGPQGGATEKVAKKIAVAFGNDNVDIIPVKNAKYSDVEKYENVIFGISTIGKETWSSDSSPNDWDIFLPELEKIDYSNKVIAMFGLGNQISYNLHFVDAMGVIAEKMLSKGAFIVGRTDTDDYEFRDSLAVIDDKFIGLPINEEFESDLTDQRISKWLEKIKAELK